MFNQIKQIGTKDYTKDYIKTIEYVPASYNHVDKNFKLYMAVCNYITTFELDIKISDVELYQDIGSSYQSYNDPYNPSQKDKIEKLFYKPDINNWTLIIDDIYILYSKKDIMEMSDLNGQKNLNTQKSEEQKSIYLISIKSKYSKKIDNFINEALECYKNEINKNKDDKRYIFLPNYQIGPSREDFYYKSYVLNDSKTFDSLFIPNKLDLLNILNNFQNRTGKYSISGVKQQLGLLLHGPSGTGKTSLIKSIAKKFNRHVVTISLSLVTTNNQLFNLMFNLDYTDKIKPVYTGLPKAIENKIYKFENIIYVIEDIDAISKIVHDRGNKEQEQEQEQKQEYDKEIQKYKQQVNDIGDLLKYGSSGGPETAKNMNFFVKEDESDKLNLAGILNAIDGIIDAPGRVIIITTNYPEKLDRALIRPGRIDKIIKMDYILEDQSIEMFSHFFCPKEVSLIEDKLRKVIRENKFTPAQLEQFALESDDINQLLTILINHGLMNLAG